MMRICSLCNHIFDDGTELPLEEDVYAVMRENEQVACRECWEKFAKKTVEILKKLVENSEQNSYFKR